MNYLGTRQMGVALSDCHPHIHFIVPSVSSLAATESSSCSRSDAELLMRFTQHRSFGQPRPRIALVRKPTADTEKAAHAQFRTQPAAGAPQLQPLRGADHLHRGPDGP